MIALVPDQRYVLGTDEFSWVAGAMPLMHVFVDCAKRVGIEKPHVHLGWDALKVVPFNVREPVTDEALKRFMFNVAAATQTTVFVSKTDITRWQDEPGNQQSFKNNLVALYPSNRTLFKIQVD